MTQQASPNLSDERLCLSCFSILEETGCCLLCESINFAAQQSPHALSLGTVLSEKYVVGKVLGVGGFGITYLGWDRDLKLKVAIKEFFPSQWVSRDQATLSVSLHSGEAAQNFKSGLEKFLDEGRTLARFQGHPGIVAVLSFFRENATGYLVMSYVEGITFKQYLEQQGGKVAADVAVKVLMPVMDALCEVHEAGILHRDISPDNIYITESGQVKLLDFGAARYALTKDQKSLSVIYKPGYAPPEQYMSEGKQGRWTDVYALAATLYTAVTGTQPAQSVERFYSDNLPLPSSLGIAIFPHVERALMRALAVDFTERFQTMREFQQALWQEGTVSIPQPFHKKREEIRSSRKGDKSGLSFGEALNFFNSQFVRRLGLISLLVAIAWGCWEYFSPPVVVDRRLEGKWEMAYGLDGTPVRARWDLADSGGYTLDVDFKDSGEFSVNSNDGWSTSSKVNQGLSRAGSYKFEDANTLKLTLLPLSPPNGITLRRSNAPGLASKSTQFSFIGVWESETNETGVRVKRTLSVSESGEYQVRISSHGVGKFSAREGLFKIRSDIDGTEDYGTYNFFDPNLEQPNRVQFIGHNVPMMMWERVLDLE